MGTAMRTSLVRLTAAVEERRLPTKGLGCWKAMAAVAKVAAKAMEDWMGAMGVVVGVVDSKPPGKKRKKEDIQVKTIATAQKTTNTKAIAEEGHLFFARARDFRFKQRME